MHERSGYSVLHTTTRLRGDTHKVAGLVLVPAFADMFVELL